VAGEEPAMRDALILAVPVLVLGILVCCWRTLYLAISRRPAAAVVWRDDVVGDEVVHFEDVQGQRHVAQAPPRPWLSHGRSGAHIIWYDPRRPERVTAAGPGSWLLRGAALLLALTMILNAGPPGA
jgi:hypothetical protein